MSIQSRLVALGYPAGTPFKEFADGRVAYIRQFVFSFGLCTAKLDLLEEGMDDIYTYEDPFLCASALEAWDGAPGTEPKGWCWHQPSGRRRLGGHVANEKVRA